MKHAYTRRSNVNSKAQANMHTSWNNQCNPDMQCSNTWTMETSHDWKSNTRSIKNWVLLEGLGKQVGFQLWLKWRVCLCVADGEWRKADYSRLRDPDRRKISGLSISFLNRGIFSLQWMSLKPRPPRPCPVYWDKVGKEAKYRGRWPQPVPGRARRPATEPVLCVKRQQGLPRGDKPFQFRHRWIVTIRLDIRGEGAEGAGGWGRSKFLIPLSPSSPPPLLK